MQRRGAQSGSDINDRVFILFLLRHRRLLYKRGSELAYSSGLGAILLLAQHSLPSVSAMNPPLQIGSRVRWWDTRGQLKHGIVRAISVMSDSSHVVTIQAEDGPPAQVTLPIDHVQLAG